MKIELFRNYLLSKELVTENQVAHYIRWVEAFLQFCRRQESVTFSDNQVKDYIDSMENRRPQWQLEQASEAISLYRFFQGKKNYTERPTPAWDARWVEAAEKMKRILRLR